MHENLHTFWSLGGHDGGHPEKYLCIFFATVTRRLSWEGISGIV